MSGIIDDIENYFKYLNHVYGDRIFYNKKGRSMQEIIMSNSHQELPRVTAQVQAQLQPNVEDTKPAPVPEERMQPVYKQESILITPQVKQKMQSQKEPTIALDWAESKTMEELKQKICNCKECALGYTRKNFVFGSGSYNADILVIGEGPGADEDAQGLPFIGRAGQLLTKILEAINLQRDEVFIANIVKCRPPGNRAPLTNEVEKCEPYLKKQIELIKPKFILALGLTAVDTLFKNRHKMADIRGKLFNYSGIPTIVTYHPAALLRNPNLKRPAWEDVKFLRSLYDEYLTKNNISK